MSAEDDFKKWWADFRSGYTEAREAYLAGSAAAALRCMDICEKELEDIGPTDPGLSSARGAVLVVQDAIKKEFGL
jgi:hypothetical protein